MGPPIRRVLSKQLKTAHEKARNVSSHLAIALAGVFLAWAVFSNRRDSYRIDLTKVGGLLDIVAGLSLALLCGALGWALVGRRVRNARVPLFLATACMVIGVVLLGTVMLGLAWIGMYRPIPIAVLVLISSAVSVHHAPDWINVMRRAWWRIRHLAHGPIGATWLSFQAAGLGALLVLALAPIGDWDSLMYHLDIPVEFLEVGNVFVPIDNRHVSFLSAIQLMYGLPLAAGLPHSINVFTLLGFIAFIGVTTELAHSFAGIRGARVAASLVWASTAWLLVATDARVEVWASCLVVLVLAAAVNTWGRIGAEPWFVVILGLLAGAAVATKLTTVPIVVFVLAAVVAMHLYQRGRLMPIVFLLACVVATSFPWFLKNMMAFGDPIFPFLSERGPDPWLRSLGAESVPGVGILAEARKPFDLFGWILAPSDFTIEGSGASQGLPPVVALGWLPALFYSRRERLVTAALVTIGVAQIAFVITVGATTNLRYLLPAMVPLTIGSAVGLAGISSKSRWGEGLVAAVIALSLVGSITWITSETTGHSFLVVARLEDPERTLEVRETAQLVALDRFLEEDGAVRAILLFEARAAGFVTPVFQDNLDTSWQTMTTLNLSQCPDLEGATHVVVNHGYLQYVAERGVQLEKALWSEFAPYADECLSFRADIGPYAVYHVARSRELSGEP